MPIGIIGEFRPVNSGSYPVVHEDYMAGGYRSVEDIGGRNAVPSGRRASGMIVYVQTESMLYQLGTGLTNSDWRQYVPMCTGVFAQTPASSSWLISHAYAYNPQVICFDLSGFQIVGAVSYPSGALGRYVRIDFNNEVDGTGYLS